MPLLAKHAAGRSREEGELSPPRAERRGASRERSSMTADPRDKAAAVERAQGDVVHQRKMLEEGQPVTVHGSHGRSYVVQKKDGFYSCTCPLWRHQAVDRVPKEKRRSFAADMLYLSCYSLFSWLPTEFLTNFILICFCWAMPPGVIISAAST